MEKSVNSVLVLSDTICKLEKNNKEYIKTIEANKELINESKAAIVEIKKSEDYKLDLLKISSTIKPKNLMKQQEFCKGYFKKEHVTILNNFSKNPK
ncbi:hypothetical protein BXA09_06525 [Campylobacter upsaliensis]|uniref:hypothetical protein n=2 Tax=Campylobacter upsaliensis TaxID=28080 RepID=UPI000E180499|nr:hypothetical protein [Campylobacter upsaliensis]EAH5904276.1 hypothetical protein [Campylobacter upsaliensis]EAH9988084.1 hypothetical protein [Campylobacter upsaliensis]EAI0687586.1 hypothetical protein [Campylobacter upsaliensis]EAI2901371.1 hypothetical protein [Campylobacter upsaliensis]EAI3917678.1 hypothetical protein [Campylobacter upsaliensis]